MQITGPNIQHNILCISLDIKEHYFISNSTFRSHTTCLSARFLLLHRSGFGFKHVLSLKWGRPPPTHGTQRVQQEVVNTITIPLHPVLVRMSGASTHLYLRRGLVCVS